MLDEILMNNVKRKIGMKMAQEDSKKRNNDDSRLSISGAMLFYRMLLDKGRISRDGASVRRLRELEKRYAKGERNFKRISRVASNSS
jgi:tRNA splicing endonuclease